MKSNGVIYMIKCYATGKAYIGQTIQKNWEARIRTHFSKALRGDRKGCKKFYSAIRKYGKENFYYGLVDECFDTREKLNELEKKYISLYKTLEEGYNLESGGTNNYTISEETRERLRISHLGHKRSEQSIENHRQSMIAVYKNNPEKRERQRQQMLGAKNNMVGTYSITNVETGEVIIQKCLKDFCEDKKLSYNVFRNILKGHRKERIYGGYVIERYEKN